MPFALSRKRFSASIWMRLMPNLPLKTFLTSLASFLRMQPWSTNTQVSCLPIAMWSRTAQTDESTPPDIASSTFLSPTCCRIASISFLM